MYNMSQNCIDDKLIPKRILLSLEETVIRCDIPISTTEIKSERSVIYINAAIEESQKAGFYIISAYIETPTVEEKNYKRTLVMKAVKLPLPDLSNIDMNIFEIESKI